MKISIITPFKNGIDLFYSTFDSVINQSYEDFEWIIVDDKSTKNQYESLVNLISSEPRVRLFTNNGIRGPGEARNIGLGKVRGEYVCFIDSDDLWDPDFLQVSLVEIQSRPGVSFIYSSYRRLLIENKHFLRDFIVTKKVTSEEILRGSDISCLTAFFRKELLDEKTLFGSIPTRNDLVFFYYLLLKTDAIPIPQVLATYRIRSRSVSSNKFRAMKYQFIVNRYYAHKGVPVSLRNVILWFFYGIRKYKG